MPKNLWKLIVSKLKAAIEEKNKVEMEAYGKAIGKALGAAGKAIYKATKGVERQGRINIDPFFLAHVATQLKWAQRLGDKKNLPSFLFLLFRFIIFNKSGSDR